MPPTWCLSAYCLPDVEHAEYLPLVVDDLGVVRTVTIEETRRDPAVHEQIEEFTRSVERSRAEAVTRGTADSRSVFHEDAITDVLRRGPGDVDDIDDTDEDVDYIAVPDSDALEQVWIGDRWPLNAGKFVMAGFENRLAEREDADRNDVDNSLSRWSATRRRCARSSTRRCTATGTNCRSRYGRTST